MKHILVVFLLLVALLPSELWAIPHSDERPYPVTCVEIIQLIQEATAEGRPFYLGQFEITDRKDCPVEPHLQSNNDRQRLQAVFRHCRGILSP